MRQRSDWVSSSSTYLNPLSASADTNLTRYHSLFRATLFQVSRICFSFFFFFFFESALFLPK